MQEINLCKQHEDMSVFDCAFMKIVSSVGY